MKGFYPLIIAQFLSAFADNATLFAVIAIVLHNQSLPGWYVPALQSAFLVAFVVLAPWVGIFADSRSKPRVLLFANCVKAIGALLILIGLEPLMAYAVIGAGAALYAPAKYGILPEMAQHGDLVKANAWIEASTILAILLGTLVGAELADRSIDWALISICLIYLLSAAVTLVLPRLPARQPSLTTRSLSEVEANLGFDAAQPAALPPILSLSHKSQQPCPPEWRGNAVDLNGVEPSPSGKAAAQRTNSGFPEGQGEGDLKTPHPNLLPKGEGTQRLGSTALFFNTTRRFLANRRARFVMLGSSLFWSAAACLRVILVAWAPLVLLLPNAADVAALTLFLAIGIVIGAGMAPHLIPLERLSRTRLAAYAMAVFIAALALTEQLWTARGILLLIGTTGGIFVVPINAAIQEIGYQSTGSGSAVAVQGFMENLAMLLAVGGYALASAQGITPYAALLGLAGAVWLLALALSLHLPQKNQH